MSRLPLLLLFFTLGVAFFLRAAPEPGYRLAEGRGETPEWLFDDPDAAYHLRRAELALAGGEVPRFDRYLNHPSGSPIPWPPVGTGVFASIARVFAGGDPSDPDDLAQGGVSESELEHVLAWTPVWMGVLATLAVALAAWGLAEPGPGRAWAATLAAWVYATLPVAVWYGGITRLDHHVLIALLLALHVAALTWSLRAEERIDAVLGSLVAGLLAGIAIATWLAAGLFAGVAGVALFARVLARDPERSRDGVRAGLLYFAAAAFATSIPATTSAWNAVQPGSLINLTEAVPRALACAIVPFAAAGLVGRRTSSPSALFGAGVASLAVAVFALPGFLTGVLEGFDWASRGNLFMDVVAESRPLEDVAETTSKLSYLVFALPVFLALLVPSALRRPERLHLVLLTAVFALLAFRQQRFGNSFAVPFACVVAVSLQARLAASSGKRRLWAAAMGAAALALVPSATSVQRTTAAEYADLRDWRAELVGALRWMRDATPSPGPWNAPNHPQDYGVLASWGLGHLIEYHARRPSITTNFGSFVGEGNFRGGAEALLSREPQRLHARMHALGARYVVVMPRHVADLGSTMRIAGEDPSELFVRVAGRKVLGPRAQQSALWRLALHRDAVGSERYPGLELVFASKRVETPRGTRPVGGEPAGPVVSIYRLIAPRPDVAPSIVPR